MPVKINQKKKKTVIDLWQIDHINDLSDESVNDQQQSDHSSETTPTVQTDIQQQHSPSAQQGNVDLWSFLAQMTQMMWQQNEMIKIMDERMKKLEEQNASTKAVEGEVVKEPEVVVPLNEDNVASYNREEDGHAEIINKVWKIMYITAQAPVMRWMQDAAPMMDTVNERRRVWNQVVNDTKYFNSENEAKAYIENLRQKGITLPGARIIACYI